jgi:hypothetical protein
MIFAPRHRESHQRLTAVAELIQRIGSAVVVS